MSSEAEAWREVIRTVDVADDLQVHVSVLTVDSDTFCEIRNWIVSTQVYGRGIVFPIGHTRLVRDALTEVMRR